MAEAPTGAETPAAAPSVRAGTSPSRPGRRDGFVWSVAIGQTVAWGVLYYAFSVLLVPMQRDLGWSRTVLVGGFTLAVGGAHGEADISGLLAPAVGVGVLLLLASGGSRLVWAAVAVLTGARAVRPSEGRVD